MYRVDSGNCTCVTREYDWATRVACLLANVTGHVATVSGRNGKEFRAAPTGRVDLLDKEPPIRSPACGRAHYAVTYSPSPYTKGKAMAVTGVDLFKQEGESGLHVSASAHDVDAGPLICLTIESAGASIKLFNYSHGNLLMLGRDIIRAANDANFQLSVILEQRLRHEQAEEAKCMANLGPELGGEA